jgi:hypothetical protein
MDTTPEIPSGFLDAVRELVEAVLVEHCLPVCGDEACVNEEHTLDCALAVLKEIRMAPELSSLHSWTERRLSEHGGDRYKWSDFLTEHPNWGRRPKD